MTTRKTKPWIHYRENEPVPAHFKPPKLKEKRVSTARWLLVLLFALGAHRFYLGENKTGWMWIDSYVLSALVFEIILIGSFIKSHSIYIGMLHFTYIAIVLTIIVMEWRALPRRVEAWNRENIPESDL